MKYANAIESHYRELKDSLSYEFEDLYESFSDDKLKILFSTLHTRLVNLFKTMNERLPTRDDSTAHFWADPSRELIETISIAEALERSLKNSQFAFSIDEYYKNKIELCNTFLSRSGGSTIPSNTEKIELYYKIPIFLPQKAIVIENQKIVKNLKLIGQGSYAQVFKYFDDFYQKTFALKRAKKDLNQKEIERFKREFQEMNNLNSPYILDVYCYNDKTQEYIMDFMDISLNDYIIAKNTQLSFQEKKSLGKQIIKAFNYIHSKQLLHRDISPKNILLKIYDDVPVVKIADFGLVRTNNSNLTSVNTELKGYFNDPNLLVEGFQNYNILHETYALTRILYFVMSGKTNLDKVSPNLKEFVDKGLHVDKDARFKNVDELDKAFQNIK